MTPEPQSLRSASAEWQETQRICAIYRGIAKCFSLTEAPCNGLGTPVESVTPQVQAAVQGWLQEMDDRIQVHHLRLFLQTSTLSDEANVRSLIRHHLNKPSRSDADRDKLDFLLVQYFSQSAPTQMLLSTRPAFAEVAKVLEPVLGILSSQLPPRLQPLEAMLDSVSHCASLRELLQRGILNELRRLKDSGGGAGFGVSELVAFARANFLIRQTFFRLMHADLETIRLSVQRLQKHGVKTIDCTRAQLGSAEPVARVLELAQQWRRPFQAEYSAGNPFAQLAELHAAVEEAMVKHGLSRRRTADPSAQSAGLRPAGGKPAAPETRTSTPDAAVSSQPRARLSTPAPDALPTANLSAADKPQFVTTPPRAETGPWPVRAPDVLLASQPVAGRTQSEAMPRVPEGNPLPLPVREAPSANPDESDKKSSVPGPGAPASAASVVAAHPAASDQNGLNAKLQVVLEQLSAYLLADRVRSRTMGATIVIGNGRLVISSWEVTGFLDPGRPFAKLIQRAVAVRVLMFQVLQQVRQGGASRKLTPVLSLVRKEAADLQRVVDTARQAHDIEATVALSAASQQLTNMLREAEPFTRIV